MAGSVPMGCLRLAFAPCAGAGRSTKASRIRFPLSPGFTLSPVARRTTDTPLAAGVTDWMVTPSGGSLRVSCKTGRDGDLEGHAATGGQPHGLLRRGPHRRGGAGADDAHHPFLLRHQVPV